MDGDLFQAAPSLLQSWGRRQSVYTLIDCNNFYIECHRAFDLKLRGIPVVVRSNNDGNAVSRSNEAKAIGVPMGEPWFKLENLVKSHGLVGLSSNYELYADMSNRVVEIIRDYAPRIEQYSIDECFLDLTGVQGDLEERIRKLRKHIKKWTNLPVCGGTASTKTLAKLANRIAKKNAQYDGVCDFTKMTEGEVDAILAGMEVGDVWGIGKRITARLANLGITTALHLKQADHEYIRQQFSVTIEKTVRELNGVPCIEFEEVAQAKKQIVSSRSFGNTVLDIESLREAVTTFVTNARIKLRAQESFASTITVFIQSNPFSNDPQYKKPPLTVALPAPTDDYLDLVRVALYALNKLYIPGFRYKKAGIMLDGIVPKEGQQLDIFGFQPSDDVAVRLATAMDAINGRWGKFALVSGGMLTGPSVGKKWKMRQDNLSPRYTTDWAGLIKAS
jgi:DNA polymerase V